MRQFRSFLVVSATYLALSGTAQAADPPSEVAAPRPIHPAVPWALKLSADVGRTAVEQAFGVRIPEDAWPEARRNGDMVIDPRDSFAEDQLAALGLPLPGVNQPPTTGVLVLDMDGVTIDDYCGNGESANGALNCSPLVTGTVNFPALDGSTAAAALQETRGYMADFDLIVAAQRPADYLPYTLAVVGGSAANAGQDGGVCGIANVACDGLKRNHVSLTFTSCGNSLVPDIIAQETSHNWGLEHTNNQQDLLYPTANGGSKDYVDSCMTIVDNGNPIACGYIHEAYCASGGGSQQNSHAEMLGVFGPAKSDTTPPVISDIQPPDGSSFSADDTITITASVTEDSNFAGVRWTWDQGVPADFGQATYTKCTNNVCDDDFSAFLDPSTTPWDFITLSPPIPEGTYSFQFEVMDAMGQSDTRRITITVGAGGGTTTGGTSTGGTSAGTTTTGGGTTATGGTTGGSSAGSDTDGGSGFGTVSAGSISAGSGDTDDPKGCGCTAPTAPSAAWLLLALPALTARRRRR